MSNSSMTPWTVAHQAPLSMGFSRQEYWSGLPFPSPEDLPNPGIKHVSAGRFLTTKPPGKPNQAHTGLFVCLIFVRQSISPGPSEINRYSVPIFKKLMISIYLTDETSYVP